MLLLIKGVAGGFIISPAPPVSVLLNFRFIYLEVVVVDFREFG